METMISSAQWQGQKGEVPTSAAPAGLSCALDISLALGEPCRLMGGVVEVTLLTSSHTLMQDRIVAVRRAWPLPEEQGLAEDEPSTPISNFFQASVGASGTDEQR